jgi:hypothetical protein
MPHFLILNLGDPIDYLILVLKPNEKMALPSFLLPDIQEITKPPTSAANLLGPFHRNISPEKMRIFKHHWC